LAEWRLALTARILLLLGWSLTPPPLTPPRKGEGDTTGHSNPVDLMVRCEFFGSLHRKAGAIWRPLPLAGREGGSKGGGRAACAAAMRLFQTEQLNQLAGNHEPT
jgi:hypothetical protein